MSNIETFPLFGWVELTYFHHDLERIAGVLVSPHDFYASRSGRGNWQLWKREKRGGKPLTSLTASCASTVRSVEELSALLFNASWDYLVEVNVRKRH